MKTTITRPGISPEYLEANQIRHVSTKEANALCGCPAAGIALPYFSVGEASDRPPVTDPDDTPFARLRKDVVQPGFGKYHQRAGTGIHAYLPASWQTNNPRNGLIVVEGEFKALSLTDSNWSYTHPAVGISGFFGFHQKREVEGSDLKPAAELQLAIETIRPVRLYFLGDADTTLNHSFSVAACRFQALFPDREIILPRMSLNGEKGVDDLRANSGNQFENTFAPLLEAGIEIQAGTDPDVLAFQLVENQLPVLKAMGTAQKQREFPRIITLLAQTGQMMRAELIKLFRPVLGMGKTELNRAVELRIRELREKQKEERREQIRPRVQNYYYAGSQYLRLNPDGSYTRLSGRDNMLTHLEQEQGLKGDDAQTALFLIQSAKCVAFAGPIAGHPAGMFINRAGGQILITEGPNIIRGRPGNPDFIRSLVDEFLGRDQDSYHEEQRQTFYGYLHIARQALLRPDVHLPGQALGLLGPVNVGKTFVQENIITPCLGGRHTDPSDYFSGRTNFNDSIFSAEHLMLSDADIDPDDKARLKFRNHLKRVVANGDQMLSQRYQSQVNIRPVWRITLSANLDKHSMAIIPVLDGSVRDKITLLRCYRPAGLPGSHAEERRMFLERLQQTLPAFVFLLDHWPIPPEYRDARFGVAAFQHPEILQMLMGGDPLRRFEVLLDRFLTKHGGQEGTAVEWLNWLKAENGTEMDELVPDAGDLGRKLATLKLHCPPWAGRIDDTGRKPQGGNRNYVKAWRLRGIVGLF